jgi:uncharacterized ferredoxin-like protein
MLNETDFLEETIIDTAKKIALAIRTAPKGRGRNTLETKIALKDDIEVLSQKMEEIGASSNQQFFMRDAGNLRKSAAVILVATEIEPLGLKNCGLCGKSTCDNKRQFPEVPCAFNTIDLGIALGSAVGLAADNRIDNRIMFSAGMAAKEVGIFDAKYKVILAISLSAHSKNIYFDRQ